MCLISVILPFQVYRALFAKECDTRQLLLDINYVSK